MRRPCCPLRFVGSLACAALVCLALLCGLSGVARAEPPTISDAEASNVGEPLTIYLITMGPGSHPFFKFGHNALWVHDQPGNHDRVYNYGAFEFDSITLVPRFFMGRFQYELVRGSLKKALKVYRDENRWLVAQRLNLTPVQRGRLYTFLEWNNQEPNRAYRYHYYRDNCSTRLRDALDRVLDGRLAAVLGPRPGELSYREHTLRLTADLLTEYVVLDLITGDFVDRPITAWEEAFIPMRFAELAREVTVVGPDGGQAPLVLDEQRLLDSTRPPARARAPAWVPRFAGVGVLTGGALAGLGWLGRRRRVARITGGVALGLLGFVVGLAGTLLVLVWLLTDHDAMWRNENILQCAPWLIALPYFAVGVARGRAAALRRAFYLWASGAALSALGLALKLLPWFDQHNGQLIAWCLPTLAGGAAACWLLMKAPTTAPAA